MKPEYRFKCQIVDETTGEVVISASTYISEISTSGECESIDIEVGSMLRAFNQKIRRVYEDRNYKTIEELAISNATDLPIKIADK